MRRKEPSCSRSEHPPAKAARCKFCKRSLGERERGIHSGCVDGWYAANREKIAKRVAVKKAREAKALRAVDRATRQSQKKIPQLIAETDKEFGGYIRLRDRLAGHPCISSGRPLNWTGNQVDAGHYRSRGAASHLRYNEDNCHAQTKQDNQFKAGNVVEYRIRLIARIGLARVEALEADNTPHKWTREELTAIRSEYRKKRKELERATP